jgi:DNA-binding transcriptional ArsR family regulator
MNNSLQPEQLELMAEQFKILSEPSRLKILTTICTNEYNVGEICRLTGLNQANVSKHLTHLKIAGVVACRRVGACRYYRVIDQKFLTLCQQAKKFP